MILIDKLKSGRIKIAQCKSQVEQTNQNINEANFDLIYKIQLILIALINLYWNIGVLGFWGLCKR